MKEELFACWAETGSYYRILLYSCNNQRYMNIWHSSAYRGNAFLNVWCRIYRIRIRILNCPRPICIFDAKQLSTIKFWKINFTEEFLNTDESQRNLQVFRHRFGPWQAQQFVSRPTFSFQFGQWKARPPVTTSTVADSWVTEAGSVRRQC